MEVYITNDDNHIKSIYSDPEILERVYTDRADMKGLLFRRPNVLYIVGIVDGVQIGLFELHPKTNSAGQMHGAVFKQHRKYAREFTEKAIQVCFNEYPCLMSIVDETPTYHMNVINFIKKMNFEFVGILKNNVSIHGIMYDTVIQQRQRK